MNRFGQLVLLAGVAAQLAIVDRAQSFAWCATLLGGSALAYVFLVTRVRLGQWRPGFVELLGTALVLRLLCLGLAPSLSDDIYRYLYEGRLVLEGENPYLIAPDNPEGEAYRDEYWPLINNKDIPAAYPPAVQYVLAFGVWHDPSPLGMKLCFGFFDLLTFVLLWGFLRSCGLNPALAAVHGLCPLLAIEFAGEGHTDSLAVAATVGACWAWRCGAWIAAGSSLAVAVAAKLMPIVFLPFVLRRLPWAVASFALVLTALYLGFVPWDEPRAMFQGTLEYGARWRSNDSAFALIHWVTEQVSSQGWLGNLEVQRVAKVPLAVLALVLLAGLWRARLPIERVALAFFLFFIACAPTVHPWYVGFLVPFLAFSPRPLWLFFAGSVYLAYHVLPAWHREQVWQESWWLKICEYLPFYLGFLGCRDLPVLTAAAPSARSALDL